jgi:hypothetical protein
MIPRYLEINLNTCYRYHPFDADKDAVARLPRRLLDAHDEAVAKVVDELCFTRTSEPGVVHRLSVPRRTVTVRRQTRIGALKRWFDNLLEGISATNPERLTVQLDASLLVDLRAYARMCHASPDSAVRTALVRLFEADKQAPAGPAPGASSPKRPSA